YEYWLLLHIYKTDKGFTNSKECGNFLCDQLSSLFGITLSLDELKQRTDVFKIVEGREGLKRAIKNAKSYSFVLGDEPYTNMHEIIEEILEQNNLSL
ncbi:MAG: RloB domain-containing protein, partial [Alphaproteobacteria bacterium]|nr:RloB domain-containing protein [Alphaproteobacteria bacterium]